MASPDLSLQQGRYVPSAPPVEWRDAFPFHGIVSTHLASGPLYRNQVREGIMCDPVSPPRRRFRRYLQLRRTN